MASPCSLGAKQGVENEAGDGRCGEEQLGCIYNATKVDTYAKSSGETMERKLNRKLVRETAEKAGLSITELAQKVGVSPVSVTEWLSG
jgi:hypothetical protein